MGLLPDESGPVSKRENRGMEVEFFHPPVKLNVSTVRSRIVILPLVGSAGAAAHRPF